MNSAQQNRPSRFNQPDGRLPSTERFNVVFQQYPEQIQLSKKRRPKYWLEKDRFNLPKGLQEKLRLKKVGFELHNKVRKLYDYDAKSFIVKNSKSAGTPRFRQINSQIVWRGEQWVKDAIKQELHLYFAPGIVRHLPEEIFTPAADTFIHFEYIFFYPFQARKKGEYQDYINHAYVYSKVFEDTLVALKILPDDGPRYVRGGYSRFVNVATEVDRRLEIKIHFCKNNQRIC